MSRRFEKITDWATIFVASLSFVFVVVDHYHGWDRLRGINLMLETAKNFDLSYTPGASSPIYPTDAHWKPTLVLIKKYSSIELPEDREPRVIARFQAVSSAQMSVGPSGQIVEWTAPSTPIAVLYKDWPGNPVPPQDFRIVGTISDLHSWIDQYRDDFTFLMHDLILGALSLLLTLGGITKLVAKNSKS